MYGQIVLLITSVVFVALALSGKVKIHVAAMLIPIVLEITGVLTFQEAWSGVINSSVIMMFSMFVVAAGFNKTDVVGKISKVFIKPGDSDFKLLVGIMIPTILLGCVVNGTANAAIMVPIIVQLCAEHKRPLSKFIYPYMVISIIWTGLLPTGGNAGSYLASNAIIENLGGIGTFNYFSNMIVKAPFAIVMTLLYLFISSKIAPDNGNIPVTGQQASSNGKRTVQKELSDFQKNCAIVIFVLTIIGVVGCALLKKSVWYAATVGALAMVLSGVLDDREAIRAGSSPIIFLFIGTLPLATALTKTGADAVLADAFNAVTVGMSPFIVMILMYLLCMVLTQFLQNSTVSNVFKMLASVIAIQNGFNPNTMFLAATMGTSNSFLLPTANAISNMLFENGGYTIKQWFKMGILYTIVNFVLFIVWVPIVFPLT